MIVYRVEGSTGVYETSKIDIGLFSTKELAEKAVNDHLEAIDKFKSKYTEEENARLKKSYGYRENDEQLPEYKEWEEWYYNLDMQEMNTWTQITEVELDKSLYW